VKRKARYQVKEFDVEGGIPKLETSFSATAKFKGAEAIDTGTTGLPPDLVERYMVKVKEC
jgi:hypothetical protein